MICIKIIHWECKKTGCEWFKKNKSLTIVVYIITSLKRVITDWL